MGLIIEKLDGSLFIDFSLKQYMKTLGDLGAPHFAAIACDQGSQRDYEIYNASKHAINLIRKELDELKEKKDAHIAELRKKYGEKDEDWFLTLDGSVHLTKKGQKRFVENGGDLSEGKADPFQF